MGSRFVRAVAVTTAFLVLVAVIAIGAVWVVDYTNVGRQASATPQITAADASGDVPSMALPDHLNVRTTALLADEPGVLVVDVRSPSEFASGHIEGAVNIPVDELDNRLAEVPTDGTVVAVCRSGRRSEAARQQLVDAGRENVHEMSGGMRAWQRAGLDVSTAP